MINVYVSVKSVMYVKKIIFAKNATRSYQNGKYLAISMVDSVIACDSIIEPYYKEKKSFPVNFNEKKAICKVQNFCNLLAFLLTIIASLIAVSIYCYLIKYEVKTKTFIIIS